MGTGINVLMEKGSGDKEKGSGDNDNSFLLKHYL